MSLEKFAVLNASHPVNVSVEYDSYVDYRDGLESYFNGPKMVKKCISWHSLAAMFNGEFFVYNKDNWQGVYAYDHILVMVKDDLKSLVPLLKKLKAMNKVVGVAYHENGFYFSLQSQNLHWVEEFKNLTGMADYFWNLNVPLEEFFENLCDVPVFSCWHAFPHEWNHGFTKDPDFREGIIVGTRTLSQNLKRNTLYALGVADRVAQEKNTTSLFLCEDRVDISHLQSFLFKLGLRNTKVIPGPLSYEKWLQLISSHKVLFHLDNSDTLGQVVGDGVLVDVPSIGSNTVNSILFGTNCELSESYNKLSGLYDSDFTPKFTSFRSLTCYSYIRKLHEEELFSKIS